MITNVAVYFIICFLQPIVLPLPETIEIFKVDIQSVMLCFAVGMIFIWTKSILKNRRKA